MVVGDLCHTHLSMQNPTPNLTSITLLLVRNLNQAGIPAINSRGKRSLNKVFIKETNLLPHRCFDVQQHNEWVLSLMLCLFYSLKKGAYNLCRPHKGS